MYFQLVLVKASATCVYLMNFCGKASIHHSPYHSKRAFVTSFMLSCLTNYIPAAQVLYKQLTRSVSQGAGYARLVHVYSYYILCVCVYCTCIHVTCTVHVMCTIHLHLGVEEAYPIQALVIITLHSGNVCNVGLEILGKMVVFNFVYYVAFRVFCSSSSQSLLLILHNITEN